MTPPSFTVEPPGALAGVLAGEPPLSPLVFASPHSGGEYPADMAPRADLGTLSLRSAEDALVDALARPGVRLGIPLIAGRLGRAYVDLNRDPGELDPGLIDPLPEGAPAPTARVVAGFGVIPRLTGDGRPLYDRILSPDEALRRLETAHRPYHQALAALIQAARARFGFALLVDWHSMPSRAVRGSGRGAGRGPDVVLGDRHGAACAGEATRLLRGLFEKAGWRVALNQPYAGGYSTRLWGRPDEGLHAIQVELNRALYLDEASLTPGAGFVHTQKALRRVIAALAAHDWTDTRLSR